MKTLKEIQKRVDEIFKVHKDGVRLVCVEQHDHSVLQKCYRADDLNELRICELCELAWQLMVRLKEIRDNTE